MAFDWASAQLDTQEPSDDDLERIALERQQYLDALKRDEELTKSKLSEPAADGQALPAGQRPTMYNRETGQWEEIDPSYSQGLGVPLGAPRSGGGDPRALDGILFDKAPWQDQGAQIGQPKLYASNQSGVPFDWGSATVGEDRVDVPELDQRKQAQQPEYIAGPKPTGLLEAGNLNIHDRPIVNNPDGSISTDVTISINADGKEVLIPTVIDGRHVSTQDAIDHFKKTGENFGKFDSPESADAYSLTLHNRPDPRYQSGDATKRDPHVFDWTTAEVQPKQEAPPKIDWNSATNLSPSLINTVKGFEGWDTGGWDYGQYSTGYGTKAKYPGEQISKEEADRRLQSELAQSAKQIDESVAKTGMKLEPYQRDALISFNYNLKPQRMPDGTMKPAGQMLLETSSNPDEIRNRLLQYNKAGGEVLPALVERRQTEATIFNGGTPPPQPDRAPTGPAPAERTTSAFGRIAGIPALPEPTATNAEALSRVYDEAQVVKDSALAAVQGFKGSLQGSSAALSEHVYKPVFHGMQLAVHALAPDSEVSKYTDGLYDEFNNFIDATKKARTDEAAQIPDTPVNRIAQAIGGMGADIGTAVTTGAAAKGLQVAAPVVAKAEAAAPTIFNIVKQEIPGLAKNAGTFAIPAIRSAMDAVDMAKKMGASAVDQSLAFWKAGLQTMGMAAIPMGVQSDAANMFQRFVVRAMKSVPVAAGVTAATEGMDDPKQLAINSIPLILLGAALGRNVTQQPRGPIATQAFPAEGRAMPGGPIVLAPSTIPPPLPTARTGPEPRIVPIFGVVKELKGDKFKFKDIEADPARTWQGTADIMEKSGFTALGRAIRDHVDKWRQYMGMTMSPFRKWAKGMSAKDINAAQKVFRDYWNSVDEKGLTHVDTLAVYNGASTKARQAIDIAKDLFNRTGDLAVANELEVFNHETGTWRPFKKIGAGFFPRRISPYWREVMNKPWQYPAEYAALKNEMFAKGYVRQQAEADAYIARVLKSQTPDDLSPIEHARTSPLPTRVYDYGFDQAVNYLKNWSWDMARIEAFGQKKFGEDLFDKSQQLTTDTYSKGYIKDVQNLAYRKQNAGAWSSTLNAANTVATVNMLANYLSSMRNAIGGILYNAHYNGVSNSFKALVNIHKMAGAIDDANERGILQDNLFHVQEDVNQMQGPVRKFTDKALGYTGQKLAEDWTRAMNLMAARSFLRDAIKANQRNPEGFRTLQYRAKIQRLGGIDPEALLREGGVGPVTDRFLRQNVAAVQGGYQYDQTPLSINRPAGRTIFQFQKWGTQAADMFVKDVVNPALQAISKNAGRKEFVQVPDGAGGMKSVRVPGNLLPAARFLLLSTAAGLTQKELQHFLFGIEDKEASFAEILSRMQVGDAGAFGDLLHKVFMANMSVGAAGIIGNYAQLLTDVTQRTRFKDPTAPPALALPKAALGLLIDGINQGTLTGMDWDAALRNTVSGYRTGQQMASQLHNAFGGDIVALKAVAARNDVSWLRSVTRRYDNSINASVTRGGFQQPTKSPLTPFDLNLKEALLMGDSLRASMLLDDHLDPLSGSQKKVEMDRIKQSVVGSQPIRAGGGTGAAMQSNFRDWAEMYLPIMDQLRIADIDERYTSTAVGLRLMKPQHVTSNQKAKALRRLEDKSAVKTGP